MKLRGMSYESRVKKAGNKPRRLPFTVHGSLLTVFLLFTVYCSLFTAASADKWSGVDESVVEKYAGEHGRAPKDPVINTDQGDMLLFLFLLGGAVAGFAAGYYWRKLTEVPQNKEHSQQAGESQKSI